MDNQGTQAPEQLIINGQEYTLEDAARYIDLGKGREEIEGKLNTSLDKVYPEYTRATQEKKQLTEELAQAKAQLTELSSKQQVQPNPDKDSAIRAARELGLADQEYLKEKGYVTKDELQNFFNEKQSEQKLVENVLTQANKLEKDIDGSDGRVPFDQKAVLAYASAYSINDLQDAYEQMNQRANAKWKESQIEKENRPGLTTLKGGGKKSPDPVKVTDDNFGDLWNELFGGSE